MIIECFGLPGVGKSTIAAGLAARLPAELVGITGRRELLALNLRAFLRHPVGYVRRTLWAFHEPGSRDLQLYKLRYVFLPRNATVEKAARYPLAVVDEGHLSNILSAFESPLSESRLLAELRRLALPDLALRVTLPHEERKRRLERRGHHSRSSEPGAYHERWESAMEMNSEQLVRVLPRLGVRCLDVDGELPIDELVTSVREALTR